MSASTTLPSEHIEKLHRYAELRGEDPQTALNNLLRLSVRRIPGNLRRADAPLDDFPVVESGVDDGYPWIKLKNGRVFYSLPTKLREANMFHLMRDRAPRGISPETFQSAIDARRLYGRAAKGIPFFPDRGATAVDAGAYVGYKAIGFADAVGPNGHVIAIELDAKNFELLEHNVRINDLTDRVTVHHCGIWSSDGELDYSGKNHMQHTLVSLDRKQYPHRGRVQVRSLDAIFDDSPVETIDFLNIQVNGAELEALQGLRTWWARTRTIRVASYYDVDGQPLAPRLIAMLKERGADIRDHKKIVAVIPETNL